MAIFLATVVGGFGDCVTTLWGLHERRFDAILEAVNFAAMALTTALAFCFLSLHHTYSRRSLPIPFL
ncbi:hypothetical protein ACSBR1_007914 [Camellia fascicularis]